jgi:uncharacterized membrane protein YdbT with pleckstrin-like domain
MSRYIQRVLSPGEKIVYEAQLHWYIYLRGLGWVVAGAVLGAAGSYLVQLLVGARLFDIPTNFPVRLVGVGVILVGAFSLLSAYIRQISTELVITDRRVIAKYGFIATTTFEVMMARIEGANIDQTILGRLLGFGTILVRGTGGGISPIDHIAAPYAFHACLMKVLEHVRQKDSVSDIGA